MSIASQLIAWEHSDWEAEAFDLDTDEPVGSVWFEDKKWWGSAYEGILGLSFDNREEAQLAVEEAIKENYDG